MQIANRAEFVGTMLVDTEFMKVFGVAPLYGRLFDADDAQRSAIVSLPFATRNFGSGERAIGQSLHLEDRTYTIVGVVPASFQFPGRTDVWVASARDPLFLAAHRLQLPRRREAARRCRRRRGERAAHGAGRAADGRLSGQQHEQELHGHAAARTTGGARANDARSS